MESGHSSRGAPGRSEGNDGQRSTWSEWHERQLPLPPIYRKMRNGRVHDAEWVVPRIQRHLALHPESPEEETKHDDGEPAIARKIHRTPMGPPGAMGPPSPTMLVDSTLGQVVRLVSAGQVPQAWAAINRLPPSLIPRLAMAMPRQITMRLCGPEGAATAGPNLSAFRLAAGAGAAMQMAQPPPNAPAAPGSAAANANPGYSWTPSGPDRQTGRPNPAGFSIGGEVVQVNAFARWMNGGPPPRPGERMNCWEMCFMAAFRAGLISDAWLRQVHQQASAAAVAGGDVSEGAYMAVIQRSLGARRPFSPAQPPSPGELILFGGVTHVAIWVGYGQVVSLWNYPNPDGGGSAQRTTIAALQQNQNIATASLQVATPPWGARVP